MDFGIQFFNIPIIDFLQKLEASGIFVSQHQKAIPDPVLEAMDEHQIVILSVGNIHSYPLLRYLQSRSISNEIAYKYLEEVHYQIAGKIYYALGFKNDAGGYELRNEYFKGSSSPKGITFVNNGAKDLAVFEGFFNFLSYQNLYYKQRAPLRNFLILNSTSVKNAGA